MRKFLFYFSLVFSLLLVIKIAQILIYDFKNLTLYGFGYLAGKLILLILFGTVIYFTRFKKLTA